MKMIKILQTVAIVAIAGLLFVSCSPSRDYGYSPRPRPNAYVSLILTPRPGFTMGRAPDGRHYHRSREGFIYWQGADNRFYLDREQVRKVRYNNREYREWKRFGKRYSKKGRY